MDLVQLKITHGDTLRKIPYPRTLPSSPYASLLVLINQRFNLAHTAQVELLVKDSDGDWVTVSSDPELHELFDSLKPAENTIRLQLRVAVPPTEQLDVDLDTATHTTGPSQSLHSSSSSSSVDDWLELSQGDVKEDAENKAKDGDQSKEMQIEEDPAIREATLSQPEDDPASPTLEPVQDEPFEPAFASPSSPFDTLPSSFNTLLSSLPLRAESLSAHLTSLLSPSSTSALSRLSTLAASPSSLLSSSLESGADLTSLVQTLSALSTDVSLAAAEIAAGVRAEAEQARQDFEQFKKEAEREARGGYERVVNQAGGVRKEVEDEVERVEEMVEEARKKVVEEIRAKTAEVQQAAEKAVEQAQATAAAVASSFAASSAPAEGAPAAPSASSYATTGDAGEGVDAFFNAACDESFASSAAASSVPPNCKEEMTTLFGEMRDETQQYLEIGRDVEGLSSEREKTVEKKHPFYLEENGDEDVEKPHDGRMCAKPYQPPVRTDKAEEDAVTGEEARTGSVANEAALAAARLQLTKEAKLAAKAAKVARKAAREERRREKEVKRAEKEQRRRVREEKRALKARAREEKGKGEGKDEVKVEVDESVVVPSAPEEDGPAMPGALPSTSFSALPTDPSGPVLLTSFLLYLRDQLGFEIDSPVVKKKLTEVWCEANGRGVEGMVERAIVEVLEV
ncbi:hypothetical protein JCM11251_000684 [Rhodosporidiobolus azoricus]